MSEIQPNAQSGDLVILPASEDDLQNIHRMATALAAFHGESCALTLEALHRDALGERPWISLFVAKINGECVAYSALNRLIRLATGQRGMELQHLFVERHVRGRGIGTRLLDTGIDFAKSEGCSYFALSARMNNRKAQAFYAAKGFEVLPPTNSRFLMKI